MMANCQGSSAGVVKAFSIKKPEWTEVRIIISDGVDY